MKNFSLWVGLLNLFLFIVLAFWISFSLIPFLKEILPFFWLDLIHPFDWLYSISKHTMPKGFSSSFYWKIKCGFSVTKAKIHDKFEPLTIDLTADCEFMNDSWIWICVFLFLWILFNKKFFSISIITTIMSICKPPKFFHRYLMGYFFSICRL